MRAGHIFHVESARKSELQWTFQLVKDGERRSATPKFLIFHPLRIDT